MRGLQGLGRRKLVLGMVHLQPLPGTPFYEHGSFARTIETAIKSVRALHDGGADGCLIQTVDRVYSAGDEADPARTTAIGLIVHAARQEVGAEFEIGVQIMRNALKASLAVATVAGGTYIRAGALVGATMTATGLIQPDALSLMEYRTMLSARDIAVVADVWSMHYEWFGSHKPVGEVAHAARAAGADAVALCHPNEQNTLDLIASVRSRAPGLPIILAGHTNHDNVALLLAQANGAFVGSCLERGGWGGEIDVDRVKEYVQIVRGLES